MLVTTSSTRANNATVTISGKTFPYVCRWSGERLEPADGYLAFDTETDIVDLKRQIPRLALASASAGPAANCLVHPNDVGKFIVLHRDLRFVCHHAAFDFWVVEQHLRLRGEQKSLRTWWEIADSNRLHDTMLLDALIRLAIDDNFPAQRDLAIVAKEYTGLLISKDDPYRLRYGEIIGEDWDTVEPGFFEYGIKDAIVTRIVHGKQRHVAEDLLSRFKQHSNEILPDATERFGLLTEAIQVKKAIALAQITRNGMHVDLETARQTNDQLREELLDAVRRAHTVCPVYKLDKNGEFVLSGKSNAPAFWDKKLRDTLHQIKDQLDAEREMPLVISSTKKGISRSTKVWAEHAHLHPFLTPWIEAQGLAKLIGFFAPFQDHVDVVELADATGIGRQELVAALRLNVKEDDSPLVPLADLNKQILRHAAKLKKLSLESEKLEAIAQQLAEARREPSGTIHPSYSVLVRTGRTSCSSPNIQQIPRGSQSRQVFMAPPGYFLLTADYSFVELRTFAATALHRYGWSQMAEVIKAGTDPHAHTAAMMLGVLLEELLTWKGNDALVNETQRDGSQRQIKLSERFGHARQAAKAVNFGVPGGLGVASLVNYAKNTYGVELTGEEARERREQLIKTVYPEMDLYLSEDVVAILSRNLQIPRDEVPPDLARTSLTSIRKILTGDAKRRDGQPYRLAYRVRIWQALAEANRNPELQEDFDVPNPSKELAEKVCFTGVATLTGRIRGRVRFSAARNTPFQALAADGAALALFELVKEGFRVNAFVHDEIHVLLPDEGGYVSEAVVNRVQEIMCRAMEQVLVGDIPMECEATLSERWHKNAKLIVEDGKVYPWRPDR